MTDIGVTGELAHEAAWTIPSRLGTIAERVGEEIHGTLTPHPSTLVHGALRVSAVVFLVDAVAGIALDLDPDVWTFTSDLSVRMPAVPAPDRIVARSQIVRVGKRSSTATVPLTDPNGAPFGLGIASFARVGRREGDPPKPELDVARLAEVWSQVPPLDEPLRDAAGITVIDAAAGVVSIDLGPELANPAGALQGAMVALVAEAAAEELAGHAAGTPQIVTDLDIRYLSQGRIGPVCSSARFVGPPTDGSIAIELLDEGADRLLAVVTARTHPAPSNP